MKKYRKKKNNKFFLIIGTTIISLIIILVIIGPIVIFKKTVELNSDISTKDLVYNVFFGTIEDNKIDTSKLGKQKVKIKAKSLINKIKTYEREIEIKDTKSPIIDAKDTFLVEINEYNNLLDVLKITDNSKDKIDIKIKGDYNLKKLGEYKIEILATDNNKNTTKKDILLKVIDTKKPNIEFKTPITINVSEKVDLLKNVKVTDNSNETIKASVLGEYDVNKVGEYKLKYKAVDSSGNIREEDFVLNVLKDKTSTPVNQTIKTSKGYTLVIKNGVASIDGIVIANKTYSLPKTYGNGLTNETSLAFKNMQSAAKKDGLNIYISSGFRSYQTQVYVYNDWVSKDGKSVADTYSARPGHSEHQTGLAMDVNTIKQSFANTKEYAWLQSNAYKYGFIMRYPKNKQDITGYIYEPWHYRYVGETLAKTLYNDGNWITIEEYFGIDSKYN